MRLPEMFRVLSNYTIGRFLICSFLITLTAIAPRAQSVRYEIDYIPLPDDLDEFDGTDILQDSEGFLWFSSYQGLFRYDGADFKQYKDELHQDTSKAFTFSGISTDETNLLIEDEDGMIWFVHDILLTRFDKKTETFRHFSDPQLGQTIRHIVQDNDGYLWLSYGKGICRFDRKSCTFKHFPTYDTLNPGSPLDPVSKVYEDSKGSLWVIFTSGDVGIFNRKTGAIHSIDDIPASVWDLLEDRSGLFWIRTVNGLYQYYRETGKCTRQLYLPDDPERLGNQHIRTMIQDSSNNYWISTNDGIYLYSENLEKLDHWKFLVDSEYIRRDPGNFVPRDLYLDKTGIIWFFLENGICKLTKQYNNFTLFKPAAEGDPVPVSDDPDHKIYVTVRTPPNDGLYEIDMKTHTQKRLIIDPEVDTVRYSIDESKFGFTIRDREGNLWIATKKWGLYRGTRNGMGSFSFNQVFADPGDSSGIRSLNLYHLFEDSKGRIWIEARDKHPCFYDPEKGRVMHLVNNPQSIDTLPGDSPLGMAWGSV